MILTPTLPTSLPPARTLPDLDRYVDASRMQPLLQSRLPGFADGALRLLSLHIDSVRRSTSRERNPCPLSLCYHLQVRDEATGREGPQTLFAQVLRGDGAALACAQVPRGRLTPPSFGAPLVAWPDLQLLLWALPNDPGLPQLSSLLSPPRLVARLQQLGLAAAGDTATVELLRHVPQDRACLRVQCRDAAGQARPVLFAKTFADDRAAHIHPQFQQAWKACQGDAGAPLVARPLAHDAAWRCLWQAQAPGLPLTDCLAGGAGNASVAQAAAALAWLHGSGLAPSVDAPARTVDWWLNEVRRRCRKIERVDPQRAAEAGAIAQTLALTAARVSARPLGLIHGDCHPGQFWLHAGRAVLFDFDEITLGDPMEDLASGLVRLSQPGLPRALGDAWVQAYAARAPARFDEPSLAWHLTVQSLLQVTRTFIYQQAGWRDAFGQRLAVASQRAASLARGVRP